MRILLLLIIPIIVLSACGGSESSPVATGKTFDSPDVSGIWDVHYAILLDSCEFILADEEIYSIEDVHEVSQDGNSVAILPDTISSFPYEGAFRSENSFLTSSFIEGDLLGEGVNCSITESLAYNEIEENSARTLFNIYFACDDGRDCETVLRGEAIRR